MSKKKQTTIYLEEINLEYLKQYQESYRLSSISATLNMLLFQMQSNIPIEVKKDKPKKTTSNSILSAMNSMRD